MHARDQMLLLRPNAPPSRPPFAVCVLILWSTLVYRSASRVMSCRAGHLFGQEGIVMQVSCQFRILMHALFGKRALFHLRTRLGARWDTC